MPRVLATSLATALLTALAIAHASAHPSALTIGLPTITQDPHALDRFDARLSSIHANASIFLNSGALAALAPPRTTAGTPEHPIHRRALKPLEKEEGDEEVKEEGEAADEEELNEEEVVKELRDDVRSHARATATHQPTHPPRTRSTRAAHAQHTRSTRAAHASSGARPVLVRGR